ncbi:MAG: hypothetical protein R2705_04345 [Ilumatobacteraceae bacterium]
MTNDESSVSTTSAASADPEWRRLTITSAPGGPAALVLPGELPASWDAWWATWSPDLPDRSNPTRVVLGRRDDRDAVRAAVAIQFGTAPDDEAINIPLSSDPVTTELWGTTAYVSTILGEPDGLALRTDALSNGTYAAAVASGFTVDELHTLLAGLRLSTSRNESFVDENALPADVVLLSQTETTGRLLVDIWPTDPSLLTLHVGDVVLQASDWVHAERLSDGSAVRIADWFARGWLSDGTAFQLDGAGLDPGTVQRVVEGLTPVSLGALESFNRANPRLDVILPEGSSFSSLQQLILSAYSDAEHPGSVCAGVTGGGGDCFDAPTPPWTKIHTFHLAGWEATVEVTLSPGDPIVNASWKVVDLRCPRPRWESWSSTSSPARSRPCCAGDATDVPRRPEAPHPMGGTRLRGRFLKILASGCHRIPTLRVDRSPFVTTESEETPLPPVDVLDPIGMVMSVPSSRLSFRPSPPWRGGRPWPRIALSETKKTWSGCI